MRIFESTIVPTSQVDFGTVHSVIPDAHNIVLTCSHMPDETFVAFSNEAIGAGKVILRATDIVPGYQLLHSGVPVMEIELPKGSIAIYTLNFRGDNRLANVQVVSGGAGVKPEDLAALAARTATAESDIAQIKTEVADESQALTALTARVATVETKLWHGTQTAYDALATKNPDTLYVITD